MKAALVSGMSKLSILAESYRNALWAALTLPGGPDFKATADHYNAYVALYRAGGSKVQRKVHKQALRKVYKHKARIAAYERDYWAGMAAD